MPNDYITPGASLAKLEQILRAEALPALDNQLRLEPTPLLQKIPTKTLRTPKIEVRTGVGMNGGFGFGAETKNIPEAGGQMYSKFVAEPKTAFATLEITHKANVLGTGDDSIHLMLNEMQGVKDAANWNVGRALFGNGTGVLATISATSSDKLTLTVSSVKNVRIGLTIDVYNGSEQLQQTARVVAIDRGSTKKITIDKALSSSLSAGFITVQGSYNKELTGFEVFFDSNVSEVYGLAKASNTWLQPRTYDANHKITDGALFTAVKESHDYANSDIDMVLAGVDAYKGLWEYLRETSTQIMNDETFVGGVAAIKVNVGGRLVSVVMEDHLDDTTMLGVDTKQLELRRTNVDFISVDDSGIFERVPNSSTYQAVLGFYGDLLCKNPGGLFKITNADYQ